MDALWTLDNELFRAIHLGWHRNWLDPVFWLITTTGLGGTQVVLVLIYFAVASTNGAGRLPVRTCVRGFRGALTSVALHGWLDKSRGEKREQARALHIAFTDLARSFPKEVVASTVALLVTIAISGLFFAQGVKRLITPRDRPSLLLYAHPQEQVFHNSFPSGHAATSFALAFMLLLMTRGTRQAWVGWSGLVWAILVGISRIYRGVHWPSDVLGSAFFGLITACAVFLALDRVSGGEISEPEALKAG